MQSKNERAFAANASLSYSPSKHAPRPWCEFLAKWSQHMLHPQRLPAILALCEWFFPMMPPFLLSRSNGHYPSDKYTGNTDAYAFSKASMCKCRSNSWSCTAPKQRGVWKLTTWTISLPSGCVLSTKSQANDESQSLFPFHDSGNEILPAIVNSVMMYPKG